MKILMAIIYFAIIVGVYFVLYYFNHRTPAPKGMEDLKASCQGCHVTDCGNNPIHEYSKEKYNHA